jgi:DNA polymerase I-like protein with 3'-5' exonuclease and polymerase domains
MISFDFETHLIRPGVLAPPIVCGATAQTGFKIGPQLMSKRAAIQELKFVLEGSREVICGQNIAFDFGCFLAAGGSFESVWDAYKSGRVHDIGIAATLNAIAEGRLHDGELYLRNGQRAKGSRYSLDLLVQEWLGRTDAKKNDFWRLRYAELENIPIGDWPEEARQYPKDDALNTLLVAEAQRLPGASSNLGCVWFQSQVAFCLHLGAIWGIRCDPSRVDEFAQEAEAKQRELKERFRKEGIYRYQGPKKDPQRKLVKDTKKLKELVSQAYAGAPPLTDKGEVSTDRLTLEDSQNELLMSLVEVGKIDKQLAYLPALREACTAPLNVRPNPLLATGRASYEGVIQLIPRKGKLRNCFAARPGHCLISVDYTAGELSTLAQVCIWLGLDSKLAEAINADLDVHSVLGADLAGLSYDDFFKRKDEPKLKDIRQAGKAGNFGFPGLMGAGKFVLAQRRAGYKVCEWFCHDGQCGKEEMLNVWKSKPLDRPMCARCLRYAEEIRHTYAHVRWTEMPQYWQRICSQIEVNDSMVQFGSCLLRGGMTPSAACNNFFQGLLAFAAKKAVVNLTKEMYLDRSSPLYGSRMLIFSHDETIIEAPLEKCHEAGFRQAEVMLEAVRVEVPDVKLKAEPAAMLFWDKDAKLVMQEGRMVPWVPSLSP